jgi:hypothetical protein
LKEAEHMRAVWRNGALRVIYARHDDPQSDEFYCEECRVECAEPQVTKQQYHSANLQQILDDLEGGQDQ